MASNSFTGWLSSIKADDIDDGLAADFDGSLSGLGVELGSSTYNMSEALLALPVFKQESLEECQNARNCNDSESSVSDVISVASESRLLKGLETPGFQYILSAATSPATKMNEETLTYLNQGQSYEIKLKRLGDTRSLQGKLLKSIIRVVFHERRLQFMERQQLDTWKIQRPGERILELDFPLSYGILGKTVEPQKLNTIEVIWDASKDTGVYVKVHCISTEFTPKKHGGEKGVPFRIQVETYLQDEKDEELLHGASCQVKIFKPKGADRKQKTDREKMEKKSESEKEKYQPSYECTVLTEIPVEHIQQYLQSVNTALPSLTASFSNTSICCSSTEPFTPKTEDSASSTKDVEVVPLSSNATAAQVTQWLHNNRFENYTRVFSNFSGADILRLGREDLIQICGLADGIRLNNALQSKSLRPRLTIYVCQEAPPAATPPPQDRRDFPAAIQTLTNGNLSPSGISPPADIGPKYPNLYTGESKTKLLVKSKRHLDSDTPEELGSSPPGDIGSRYPNLHAGDTKKVPTKSKRHYFDSDTPEEPSSSKKQRTRRLDMYKKEAYHAIYLETVTLEELVQKVAMLFNINHEQFTETYMKGPSGINVLCTDHVVQNFQDQTRFTVEALQDEAAKSHDKYHLFLKAVS